MARDPDLDLVRLWADASLPPEERMRRLEEFGIPEVAIAPPEGRLASLDNFAANDDTPPPAIADGAPPPARGGLSGTLERAIVGGAPPAAEAPPAFAFPDEAPPPAPTGLRSTLERAIGPAPPPAPDPNAHVYRSAAAPVDTGKPYFPEFVDGAHLGGAPGAGGTQQASDTVNAEGEPSEPARRRVSPAEYRARLDRAALLRGAGAGAGVPQERVQEEMLVERGGLRGGDRVQLAAAHTEADILQQEADSYALQREEAANRIQLAALNAQEEEARALAKIRAEELAKAKRARARANDISEEIAAMKPAEEGLFVGKNAGESMMVALGALAMGLGMGATGNAGQIIPTLRQFALREVDRQRRAVEMKQGAIDQLGTIYERHLANLADADLASKLTAADIMRSAERQMLELANDPATMEGKRAALGAAAAQIRAERIKELAAVDQQLGDKVRTNTTVAYQRARQTAQAPRVNAAVAAQQAKTAPVEANPKPRAGDFANPADYFRALADWQEREEQLEAEAVARAKAPKPKAAPAKPRGGDTVLASTTGGKPKPDEPPDIDELDNVSQLFRAGKPDAAVAAMGPNLRAYFFKLVDQSVKNLGEKAESSDAVADAFRKLLGEEGPVAIVPRTERDRIVSDGDKVYFAPSAARAQEAQKSIVDANKAISLAGQMKALADKFKGTGYKSAEIRGKLLAIGSDLMAILSKVDEQGVIREGGDEQRYQNRAGLAVQDFIADPTTDPAAAVGETLRTLRAGKQRVLGTLSDSWRDFESAAPGARRREASP